MRLTEDMGRIAALREARLLGLRKAVVVAVGWDSLILGYAALAAIQAVSQGHDPLVMDWLPAGRILLAFTVVSVLAAAPLGWILGPRAVVSEGPSKSVVVVAMGLGAAIVGDLIVSLALAFGPTQSDNAFGLAGIAMGAVILGPLTFLFVTLPSAVIWFDIVERTWRRRSPRA